MSQLSNKSVSTGKPGEPAASPGSTAGWPAGRVFLLGAVVIVGVVAALLVGIRTFLFPVWEANSEGARQVATAEAQLSVARTQEALAARPTGTVLTAAAPQPTAAPVTTPTVPPVALTQLTVAPTAGPLAAATSAPAASATPSALPTVPPEQAAEIAAAYKRYFDVSGEALLNLDPTSLDEVTSGQELAGLQRDIEEDRAQGRALQTNVQHEAVVIDVQGDEADVADRYKDSSIYVNPISHEPLPGQVVPASPDVAPAVSVVYHLQRIDGVWKVVSGKRFVPQGSQ
jgi:hypothetical protein